MTPEQAVMDALAESLDGPVTGFVAIATHLTENGEEWTVIEADDQSLGTSLGMVRGLDLTYQRIFNDTYGDEP